MSDTTISGKFHLDPGNVAQVAAYIREQITIAENAIKMLGREFDIDGRKIEAAVNRLDKLPSVLNMLAKYNRELAAQERLLAKDIEDSAREMSKQDAAMLKAQQAAEKLAQSYRNIAVAQQRASNKNITGAGGFDWITGAKSDKDAKESARAFSDHFKGLEDAAKKAARGMAGNEQALKGLERVTANIVGGSEALKGLEANAYAGSRGFAVLGQTIFRDPIPALRALADGSALAGTGMSRMGVAAQAVTEILSFAAISRFGAIAAIFATIGAAKQAFDMGVQGAKEFDQALIEQARFLVLDGKSAASAKAEITGLVSEQRKFAASWAITVAEQSQAAQRLLATGMAIQDVKKSYQDFSKFQIAFPEVDMEKYTVAVVGLMNASRNMTGYKDLANDAERLKKLNNELAQAAASSLIEPKDFPVMISHMASMSTLAGILPEEMLALGATLTDLGIKSQNASRLFRGLIVSLSSTEKIKALEDMGVVIDRTKPLGPQLQGILAQLVQLANVDMQGSVTVEGLSIINSLLPAERASIGSALMKDIANGAALYSKNLSAITSNQQAVDNAAKLMNSSLNAQDKILENLKKELFGVITDLLSLRDVNSGVAQSLAILSLPLYAVTYLLRATGNYVAFFIVQLGYLWDALKASTMGNWEGIKQAGRNALSALDVLHEQMNATNQAFAERWSNAWNGAQAVTTQNAQRNAEERTKIAVNEAQKQNEAIKSRMTMPNVMQKINFGDAKFFDDIADKLRQIREINPFESWKQIERNNEGLRNSLVLLKLAGNDSKKFKDAMKEVADETVKVANNHKIVKEAIDQVISTSKEMGNQARENAKLLIDNGSSRMAEELLQRSLYSAKDAAAMATDDKQRIDALNQQISLMKTMQDLGLARSGGFGQEIAQAAMDVQALSESVHKKAVENATKAKAAVAESDMTGAAKQIQKQFEEWPSALDRSVKAIGSKNGLRGAMQGVLDLANEVGTVLSRLGERALDEKNRLQRTLSEQINSENKRVPVPEATY